MNSPDSTHWVAAMHDELQSLTDQGVYTIVERTPDMHFVGAKWVYKLKTDENYNPVRYKARLVAPGLPKWRASTTTLPARRLCPRTPSTSPWLSPRSMAGTLNNST